MSKKVIIIGGGVAGMQAAVTLEELGIRSVIIEKEDGLGGKLRRWDRLFPTMTPAEQVLDELKDRVQRSGAEVKTSCEVSEIGREGRVVTLKDGTSLEGDAVVVASGFDLFPAELKEEYGYKKAGVILWDMVPDEGIQTSLFDECNRVKMAQLQKAMDDINRRNGDNTVRLAIQGGCGSLWKGQRNYVSPSYTTDIRAIIRVNEGKKIGD